MDRRNALKWMAVLGTNLLVGSITGGLLADEGHRHGPEDGRLKEPRHHEGHDQGHREASKAPHGRMGHEHGEAAFERYGLVRTEERYKEYNVRLQQYSYTPEVIRAERGDLVKLNLDSIDVQHGFYIDGYGVAAIVPEEGTKTVEFVAKKAGAFRIRCSSTCGAFHPFMIGKLVVEPNYRFWWALTAVIVAPLATLAYLAHNGGPQS